MGSRLAARHAHHPNHLRQIFRVTTTAAFAIADNCIAELPGWNDKLLAKELKALFDSGYDLNITGFTTADLHIGPISEDFTEKPKAVEQYQQYPVSPKGGIIQFEWLKSYAPTFVPVRPGQIVASWYTASKAGLDNDYSVCVIGHVRGFEVRVLEVFRVRLIFPELKRHVVRLAIEYKVDVLRVEDAASGQ